MKPGKREDRMKKNTKIIISVIITVALLVCAVASVFYIRHELEQRKAIAELSEQIISIQEEQEASVSGETITDLENRITALESETANVPESETTEEAEDPHEASKPDKDAFGLVRTDNIVIPVFSEENMKAFELPENEALRFSANLKAGWNLGNTFDAQDAGQGNPSRDYETYWCGARTTRELIHAIKSAGFNVIRIPVSWHNHVTGDRYRIDDAWMNRIREVAQWIVDEDMYFIINIHHDNSKDFLYPDNAHYQQSEEYLTAIWAQISEAFSDFDDHCIFECMNEPRLVGSNYEWWLNQNAPECKEAVDCINRLNQKFVDTVRAAGGNNATRYLLVPGYCGSPDGVLTALFRMPEDNTDNRIMIEVHAYTPYNYALNKDNPDSSFNLEKDKEKKSEIATFMNRLYNEYIANGIPVLIDEFGALQKKTSDLQDRVNFAAYYVASASARGITCVWWDNHAFTGGGERFGLIDRKIIQWKYPDIALAILENCEFNRR